MTRGITDPKGYYYRRVYTDGVRAVEAVLTRPETDPDKLAVVGGSQGGGIAIAVAGLEPRVKAAMPDVPFLCDFPPCRRPHHPRSLRRNRALSRRCTAQAAEASFKTLNYFDGVHFRPAPRRPGCSRWR